MLFQSFYDHVFISFAKTFRAVLWDLFFSNIIIWKVMWFKFKKDHIQEWLGFGKALTILSTVGTGNFPRDPKPYIPTSEV